MATMFGSIWNFVKRHKRKFMYTGVVIGGIALMGKYAKKKLQEYQDLEAEECLAHARKQHHFDSNQRTCNLTVLSMIPNLRETLLDLLQTEALTAQLKNKPANKLEIWDELKVLSFTRTLLAMYSSCLLIVFLRVQLNILGGYMYLDSLVDQNRKTNEPYHATPDVQQKYLALVQHFLEKGKDDLSQHLQASLARHLKEIHLRQQISLVDIQTLMAAVRRDIEGQCGNGFVTSTQSKMMQYLLPEEDGLDEACSMTSSDVMLQQLKYETRDMLESSDFHCVLTGCLDTGFIRLVDKLAEYFKPSMMDGAHIVNPTTLSMPLAKVIPVMNGLIHTVLADSPNTFVQELLLKEQVKNFAANVYEAFSQTPSQQSPA